MTAWKLVALYGITAVVFFALDSVWLWQATPRVYEPYLRDLLAPQPRLGVAAGFYVLYVVGILALAVVPGLREGSVIAALWRGALFGFLAYATYDLTNLAIVRDWPWQVSVIDMIWGVGLNSVVTIASFYVGRWLGIA